MFGSNMTDFRGDLSWILALTDVRGPPEALLYWNCKVGCQVFAGLQGRGFRGNGLRVKGCGGRQKLKIDCTRIQTIADLAAGVDRRWHRGAKTMSI
jgi:hypothetical protein